jgi:hypothetical protein
MKKLISALIVLLCVTGMWAEYNKNVASQVIPIVVRDTLAGYRYWVGNDSNKLAGYVIKDGAQGLRLHGTFAASRDSIAGGGVIGFHYTTLQTETNCDECDFIFTDTGNHIPDPVFIHTIPSPLFTAASGTACSSLVNTNYGLMLKLPDTTLLTRSRMSKADSIDAKITTRLATTGYTAPNNTVSAAQAGRLDSLLHMPSSLYYTTQRSGYLDSLDQKISACSRPAVAQTITAPTTMVLNTDLTTTRIHALDSLNAAITTRMATFTYTAPNNKFDSTIWTAARAHRLDSLDKKISSISAGSSSQFDSTIWTHSLANHLLLTTDTTHWGALRALRIDNYISSRQPKTTGH